MNEISPFEKIYSLLDQAIENDNPDIVVSEIAKLHQGRDIVGKILAKIIGLLEQSWYRFSISKKETFEQVMLLNLGIEYGTLQRYRKWWRHHPEMPKPLQEMPIRYTIPVTNSLSQGYEITSEQYDKLEKAGTNLKEIQRIVTREVKGKEQRKTAMHGNISRDGTLYRWYDGERYDVGYLDVTSTEEPIREYVDKIINTMEIRRQ